MKIITNTQALKNVLLNAVMKILNAKLATSPATVKPTKNRCWLVAIANMDIKTATANAITLRFAKTISDILISVFFTQSLPQLNYISNGSVVEIGFILNYLLQRS